jgi:DNA-binding Xre family transcriptional regulator
MHPQNMRMQTCINTINDALLNIIVVFSILRYNGINLREVQTMAISYNKLWKLLIDKNMKKKDLQRLSGISSATITKLGRTENVNTEILQKICTALECDICDVMEFISEKKTEDK